MSAEQRIRDIGLELSSDRKPAGNYAAAVQSGDFLFLSGKAPLQIAGKMPKGRLGREYTSEEGYALARSACVELIAVIRSQLGSLDRVSRIVELQGSLNAIPEFEEHARVLDGASDLLVGSSIWPCRRSCAFGNRGQFASHRTTADTQGNGRSKGIAVTEYALVIGPVWVVSTR